MPNKLHRKPSHTMQTQAGVSLMLAVLVLSAITAIAFSLAAIIFIEIRSSGDVLRTEPALYATLGVTEEALFQYKRYVDPAYLNVTSCPDTPPIENDIPGFQKNICSINGVTLSLPPTEDGPQPVRYDNTPRVETVPGGSTTLIPLYQVDDFSQQYSHVHIEALPIGSQGRLSVSFRETDTNGNITTYGPYDDIYEGSPPLDFTEFDPNGGQFDMILDNSKSGDQDIVVSIYTYDNTGSPRGVPFLGQQVLHIVANYLGLTRTYLVKIPLP